MVRKHLLVMTGEEISRSTAVIRQNEPLLYIVRMSNGVTWCQHIDQLLAEWREMST